LFVASINTHGRVALLPLVQIRLVAARPKPYPEHPQTLAEHIKRRRLELGLTRKQAAERLSVDPLSVSTWETGRRQPLIRSMPAILEFLGYDPFPPTM
jgi:DNA-binding transcriptional regulator YiaG